MIKIFFPLKDMNAIQNALEKKTGARSVPRVFINGHFYGGGDDTVRGVKTGEIQRLVEQVSGNMIDY